MKVLVVRYSTTKEDTLGALYIDGVLVCYTLEDEKREIKVHSETRIPAGTYEFKLKTVGGFHNRYSDKFPKIHKGMLQLVGVPGFTDILIHIGNSDDDTAGCLLVGSQPKVNSRNPGGLNLAHSKDAYVYMYPIIASAINRGEEVTIEIRDFM